MNNSVRPPNSGMTPDEQGTQHSIKGTVTEDQKFMIKDIDTTQAELYKVYTIFEESYDAFEKLKGHMETCRWEGESKEAFVSLCSLNGKLHRQLISAIYQNGYSLIGLEELANEFMDKGSLISLMED